MLTPTRAISARTQAEMEAGRRRVTQERRSGDIAKLKASGTVVPKDADDDLITAYVALAAQADAIPEDNGTYRCKICSQDHKIGSRCPNSARKYVCAPE